MPTPSRLRARDARHGPITHPDAWVYPGGTAGRDRDHRHADRTPAARRPVGPRGCPTNAVPQPRPAAVAGGAWIRVVPPTLSTEHAPHAGHRLHDQQRLVVGARSHPALSRRGSHGGAGEPRSGLGRRIHHRDSRSHEELVRRPRRPDREFHLSCGTLPGRPHEKRRSFRASAEPRLQRRHLVHLRSGDRRGG